VSSILSSSPASRSTIEIESEWIVEVALARAAGLLFTRLARQELYLRIRDRAPEFAIDFSLGVARERAQGKPLQYLLGFEQFGEHVYEVTPAVLIPRQETEILFRVAIERLQELGAPRSGLELGVGSGVLSIELLHHFSSLSMQASELSESAIHLAEKNAARILSEPRRLKFLPRESPLVVLQGMRTSADFLISNPPYLDPDKEEELTSEVKLYEPTHALFAPAGDPLYFYRGIAEEAPRHLKSLGFVFLEIPHERADAIAAIFRMGHFRDIQITPDLTGRPRVLTAILRDF
jgi:release factor glutamine methyltransferase